MGFKTLCAFFLALVLTIVIAEATSPALDSSTSQELSLTPTDTVGYLRTRRQLFPYGGYGGGSSIANAQASAFSGGGGFGFPGSSFSGASAAANAGSFGGFGK